MFKPIFDIISNIGLFFMELLPGKKVALMVAGVLILAALMVLSFHSRKPEFEVLLYKLSSNDMGEIIVKLEEKGIDYKLTDEGAAILVPSKDVIDLKIQLASAGLPRGKGNIFSEGKKTNGEVQLSLTQFEFKQNIERDLENRVKSMLGVVVGPEKITTQISADIDFNQTEQTEEIFDPDSQVIRSEKIDEESNIGVKPWKSLKANENINYEINKITRRTISPVGKIKQLSIAVMVDGTYDKTNKYVPRNAIEMLQYGRIVERAVGYDEERGDKIEVVNIPFDGVLIKDEEKTMDKSTKWGFGVPMVFWAVTLIFMLILLVLLIKSLIAWIRAAGAKKPKGSVPYSPKDAEEEVVEQAEKIVSAPIKEDFRKAVQDYARKEPTHTAELMRKWLKHKR